MSLVEQVQYRTPCFAPCEDCNCTTSFDHAVVASYKLYDPFAEQRKKQREWDVFFLGVAKQYATKSKDPSTQVGAVIVRPDHTPASFGFNGFPRGMRDDPETYANRDAKLSRMIHAELNALLFAREDLTGYTMYVSFFPCERCAPLAAHMGINRIVCPRFDPVKYERWKDSYDRVQQYAKEMNFIVDEVDLE